MLLQDGDENGFYVKKNEAVVSGARGMRDDLLHGLRHDYDEIREPGLASPRTGVAENIQRHSIRFQMFLAPGHALHTGHWRFLPG
jgi:hypothetical protein